MLCSSRCNAAGRHDLALIIRDCQQVLFGTKCRQCPSSDAHILMRTYTDFRATKAMQHFRRNTFGSKALNIGSSLRARCLFGTKVVTRC